MSITSIAELIPDPKNARKRGPRAEGMLVASLHEVGAARSIVVDENNMILAGHGTVQAAAEAGIEKLQIVDADGETIVAVRRTGLTDAQKKRLAVLDNRTGELAEWDAGVLAELAVGGIELDDLWSENELNTLLGNIGTPDDPRDHWNDMNSQMPDEAMAHRALTVYFRKPEDVEAFCTVTGLFLTDAAKSTWFPKKTDEA
jgi:hypothetical protein